jgi:hypothetical protein
MLNRIKQWFSNISQRLMASSKSEDGSCRCSGSRGLFLDQRQLNRTLAMSIITGLFLFLGGYFWGQHAAVDQVLNNVERDSFADQIYYSMCPANEAKEEGETADTESDEETEAKPQGVTTPTVVVEVPEIEIATSQPVAETNKTYFAQLAGFGHNQTAQRYAQRLQHRGFQVHVVKRMSKSARGRGVSWYQVVTDDFTDKGVAEKTVALLKSQERLNDIKLLEK